MDRLESGRKNPKTGAVHAVRENAMTFIDRIDPIHEVTWKDGVNLQWHGIRAVVEGFKISATGQIIHERRSEPSPIDLPPYRTHSNRAVQVVAQLAQYYQLSTFQIATLLGSTPNRIWRTTSALFGAGIIERAIPGWIEDGVAADRGHGGSGSVWRLAARTDRLDEWLSKLSDLEYALVTGGVDISMGTTSSRSASSVRHNLSAAEIMIRAQEMVPGVIGAWGEAFTSADMLLPPGVREGQDIRQNIGDGVLVTRDGKLIIIETSGASKLDNQLNGPRIQNKAAAWSIIAALSNLDITVIFVDIAHTPRKRLQYYVKLGVESAASMISDTYLLQRGTSRIFAVDAWDWFPFELAIAEGFLTLEAWSPITNRYHDVIPLDVPLRVEADPVLNTVAALHTPKWVLDPIRSLVS